MSNFFICMNAFMTLCILSLSGPVSNSGSTVGTTCQETPNLSFNQPQADSSPPSVSRLQKWVDLVLGVTVYLEGDSLVELELRPAVESHEFLAFKFELHHHDRSRLLAMNVPAFLAIAAGFSDP